MARRLWSALLLVCLFTNLAFGQILANPALDNQDPVRCFDHVYRDARNAAQAYQIVYAPGWKEEVTCHGKVPAPDLEPCWAPVLQARPLIERAAQLFEQARRTPAPQQGQLVAQGNALMRQAAGLLDQAGKCFQPIFARWQQNGGRYVAGNPNPGGGDVFSSNSNTGGPPADTFSSNSGTGGLPGEPRIDQYGRDTECGGTDRRYYDAMYGTKAVVISVQEMNQLYTQGRIIRCGACKQNVICWLKPGPTAGPAPQPKQPPGPTAGPTTPPKQLPRESTPDRICTLRDLAALVFERYGSGSPIATVRAANRANTYILLLQGVDDQEVQLKDAAQAYFRNAGSPELRLIENLMRLANGDPYEQGVIDAVNQLPPGATLLVAGHSLGGIEAQNIVGALRGIRPDIRVSQVFSFGAPVVGSRAPGPQYLDIKATKGVPDLVAVPALDRGVSTGIININGDTNNDLYDTVHGSHFVYPKSPDLAALGLDGQTAQAGVCLTIEIDSLQSYSLGDPSANTRWPTACPQVSFRGQGPVSTGRMFNGPGWQSWSQLQGQAWQRATTVRERNVVSERIGEKGMEIAAQALGYKPLLLPGQASDTPQGFDAVYLAPDGTYVVAEAKGGYNGDDLDRILGYGYRCRQGTLEWARRAAERILTAGKTGSQEQEIAQQLRNRILTQAPGFGVRVEVFQTEHNSGVPGVTKRYVTSRSH